MIRNEGKCVQVVAQMSQNMSKTDKMTLKRPK